LEHARLVFGYGQNEHCVESAAPRLRGDRERRRSPDIMDVFNIGEEELAMH
jgi:hypothetical protein